VYHPFSEGVRRGADADGFPELFWVRSSDAAEWLRKVVKDRLGITPDEIDGSHCVALSRPKQLADRLETYAKQSSDRIHSVPHGSRKGKK
jgi:hypothetical protein